VIAIFVTCDSAGSDPELHSWLISRCCLSLLAKVRSVALGKVDSKHIYVATCFQVKSTRYTKQEKVRDTKFSDYNRL
jgi:hypothetical protein